MPEMGFLRLLLAMSLSDGMRSTAIRTQEQKVRWKKVDDRRVRFQFPTGARDFSQRPDRLRVPPSLTCSWHQWEGGGGEWSGRALKLTTLVPRLRMVELCHHSQYIFMAWCIIKPTENFTLRYVFWGKSARFGGTHRLHIQGWKVISWN
jgi:hypothetical protein